ncbi:MAG: site-specific integrase [Actinophytocola sp.]|uniref:site-specific integrase n=1 Tax=Actinophytocola sp. TaxID=1872138 RepID=UPI003C73D45F
MTKRRDRGDGGLRWSESRQRWIGELTIGYRPDGKRIVKTVTDKTKTGAKNKLDEVKRDFADDELATGKGHTVADAVNAWLKYGLAGRSQNTIDKLTSLAETHVIPALGARELRNTSRKRHLLTADDVDEWLAEKAQELSTRTLREVRSILLRSITRAQKREGVKRNVVLLCDCPTGQEGRPSKSLTLKQAEAVLTAAEADQSTIGAYIVTSLLGGVRTEEARPLTWSHVHIPRASDRESRKSHIDVWRSVRVGGDTKTRKSRRSLVIPDRCVAELRAQKARQRKAKKDAGSAWRENDLVFASEVGTELDAHNVRRAFRRVVKAAKLNPWLWTPRELRHSFVSLLSDASVPIEVISRLVGHSSTEVTEKIYRHQLRPVVERGADAMDQIFPVTAS